MLDLSPQKNVSAARHWYSEVNQLYHPTGVFGQDSQEVVYASGVLEKTKFQEIFLKEVSFLLKKGGVLILDYTENDSISEKSLEKMLWHIWKGGYNILFHGSISSKQLKEINKKNISKFITSPNQDNLASSHGNSFRRMRLVCEKVSKSTVPGDSTTKWTFGIITNGKRKEWVEKIISSIKAQKIPHYEIIICGDYTEQKDKKIILLPFKDRDEKGWITKKKNMIMSKASYNNVCILHDRVQLGEKWFSSMQKYGNAFEVLTCKQTLPNGERVGDWLTTNGEYTQKTKYYQQYRIQLLDYRDWDRWSYIGGQMIMLKKHVWENVMWDETLYWNDSEDIDLSRRLYLGGFVLRCIPNVSCINLTWRHGNLTQKPFGKEKKYRQNFSIRTGVRNIAYYIARVPGVPILVQIVFPFFATKKMYQYLVKH